MASGGVDLSWVEHVATVVLSKMAADPSFAPSQVRQVTYFASVPTIADGEVVARTVRSWKLEVGVFVGDFHGHGAEVAFARTMVADVATIVEDAKVIGVILEHLGLTFTGLAINFDGTTAETSGFTRAT